MPQTQVDVAKPGEQYCHVMIRKVAWGMAREVYEDVASQSDTFYKSWPKGDEFADEAWGLYLEDARHTLGKLLATPIPEKMKDEISRALIEDEPYRVRRNRARAEAQLGQSMVPQIQWPPGMDPKDRGMA